MMPNMASSTPIRTRARTIVFDVQGDSIGQRVERDHYRRDLEAGLQAHASIRRQRQAQRR